jgi:hydroxymethylpyrimidine pyrophosphatase-like HAD family hydrolase
LSGLDAALAVAPAGLSKWSGVLVYCERHGVDATRVLAIGDQVNDIELIAISKTHEAEKVWAALDAVGVCAVYSQERPI